MRKRQNTRYMCINGKRQNTRYIHIDEKDKIQDIHIDEKKIKYKIYIYILEKDKIKEIYSCVSITSSSELTYS